MNSQNIAVVGASLLTVGLSAIVKIEPTAYLYATNFKIHTGSGTLEVVPPPLALSGTLAVGWGLGYRISSNESVFVDGPARIYLAATSATMTVSMLIGYSSGATVGV